MDVTQGLDQELERQLMVASESAVSETLTGDAADLQDVKIGEAVFLAVLANTNGTEGNEIDVDVTIQHDDALNASDNLDSGAELTSIDFDALAGGGKAMKVVTASEFNRYAQVYDINDDDGAGDVSFTLVALGGKRES